MSRYSGRYGKGAAHKVRALKRREADERNAVTLPERRRAFRRQS